MATAVVVPLCRGVMRTKHGDMAAWLQRKKPMLSESLSAVWKRELKSNRGPC